MRITTFCLLGLFLLTACNTARRQAEAINITFGDTKPTIIYKTTQDFSPYVPVILSADKSSIVSYPGPNDIYYEGELALPVALEDGYWLDRRGINQNVAFLDITYEEFAAMKERMSPDELFARVQDDAPLLACYDCGNLADRERLNLLIKGGRLDKCREMTSE